MSKTVVIDIRKKNQGKVMALLFNSVLIVDLARMLTGDGSVVTIAVQYSIYFLIAAYAYWHMLIVSRAVIRISLFLAIVLLVVSVVASAIITPAVTQAYGYYSLFLLLRIVPAIYLFMSLDKLKMETLFNSFLSYRLIWIIYAVVGLWWIPLHTTEWNQYSMTYGYNLIIPTCVVLFYFLKSPKTKYLFYSVGLSACIVLKGSRGSFVCVFLFAVSAFVFIRHKKKRVSKKVLWLFIIFFLAGILVALLFSKIINALDSLLNSSRTLRLLTSNISFDSGRGSLFLLYFDAIKLSPFRVNGIFSDRIYFSEVTGRVFDLTNYPHNFLLEVIYQFGMIIGIVLLGLLAFFSVKTLSSFVKIKNTQLVALFLILLVSGVLKLFLSGSYLISVEFYAFIGLLLCDKNGFMQDSGGITRTEV